MTTQAEQIVRRIRRSGRGQVFTVKDFLDIGTRRAADLALSRLVARGNLHRVGRGLYYFPRVNRRLKIPIGPDADAIAEALARQTGNRVVPSGATAANRLGLSTQIPAQPVYLTDGRSRRVTVGAFQVVLKHVAAKDLPAGSSINAMVVQALRFIGRDAIDEQVIAKLRRILKPRDRAELLRDARYATDWIAEAIRKIAEKEEPEGSL